MSLSLGAFDNFHLCLTGSGPWLLFTSSLAFSVFQAVFWRECLQCCQQYCSAVTVWLCRVFLCYIELHGTVLVGFLCSHWSLAFPQTLTFSAYLWSWQAPFHFLPLSYWENGIFLLFLKTLRRLSFALGLVQLTAVQASSGSPAKIYFEFFLCLLMHDLLPLSSLGQLLETCFCGPAEPMLT